jgi:hypothetical protein
MPDAYVQFLVSRSTAEGKLAEDEAVLRTGPVERQSHAETRYGSSRRPPEKIFTSRQRRREAGTRCELRHFSAGFVYA